MNSPGSQVIVVDASVAVTAAVATVDTPRVLELLRAWRASARRLVAPHLLIHESVSAIRRYVRSKAITASEADLAVADVFALSIECVASDVTLCREALRWADRLGHARAYDGFYVALAEREGAELWTADERLVHALEEIGGVRAHSVRSGGAT